jgi:hypothetical protein
MTIGKYTNVLQAAILYDDKANVWPSRDINNFRMAMLQRGIPLNITQESPTFAFMMGAHELQITVTYYDHPADNAVFRQALLSPSMKILAPDAEKRVQRHRSHVLVEIQQGSLGGVANDPSISKMFADIGFKPAGGSLHEFNMRVDILAEICRFLQKEKAASLIHWTQSNTLIPGEKLDAFLQLPNPGMLTVHPYLFAAAEMPGYDELPVEIVTVGAADFIGREIHVQPAPIPWMELYESALAFIRLGIMPNGYIIPDKDSFGIEGGEFSYLVRHLDGVNQPTIMGEPLYELKLQFHKKYNYVAPDFNRGELIKGGPQAAAQMINANPSERQEAIAEWENKERMIKKAGGTGLNIFKKPGPDNSAPPPSIGVFGRVAAVFGRKKSN